MNASNLLPNVSLQVATIDDCNRVAEVYLRSRKELVSCAPLIHSDESVRDWIRSRLIPLGQTTIAVVDDLLVAFLAVSSDTDCSWIDHLYVHPEWVDRGIGARLLEHALQKLSPPVRLYTFQCNERARHFYERHGFRAIAFGDDSGNEEHCPDILYEWLPAR